MNFRNTVFALLLAGTPGLLFGASASFGLDKAHTRVGFGVKHLVVSTTEGKFKDFDGSFDFDTRTGRLKNVNVTIKTSSIYTANAKRDGHLKSGDFFDAAKHPTITFVQTGTTRVRKGRTAIVRGKLTIRGTTKNVRLRVTYNGNVKLGKKTKVGFVAKVRINRFDYGLKWNGIMGGRVAVGKWVNITINGEADSK